MNDEGGICNRKTVYFSLSFFNPVFKYEGFNGVAALTVEG